MINNKIVTDYIKDIQDRMEDNYKEIQTAIIITEIMNRDFFQVNDELIEKVYEEMKLNKDMWNKKFVDAILKIDREFDYE